MHIAIIGAGLTGICTALELSRAGHQVEVFERQRSVAAAGSFAGGGILAPYAPSALTPATWSLGGLADRWWHFQHRQVRNTHPPAQRDALLAQWATDGAAALRDLSRSFRQELESRQGWLLLAPDVPTQSRLSADQERLATLGLPHRWLEAEEARQHEPGLNPDAPLAGALLLPQVPVVNTRQLAQQLRLLAEDRGVNFRLGAEVIDLEPGRPVRLSWQSLPEADRPSAEAAPASGCFDAVVLCGGAACERLLVRLALPVPWRRYSGCSLTAALQLDEAWPDRGPRAGLTDAQTRVHLSRLGDRVRLSRVRTGADSQGAVPTADRKALHLTLDRWFPHCRRRGSTQEWHGEFACLPDDAPLCGPSRLTGLWLNLGHGAWGAALAWGIAKLLREQMSGLPVGAEAATVQPARWGL